MKAIIIEDESLARERLRDLIKKYQGDIQIVEEFDSVEDSIDYLQSHDDFDLLFLDIQLSDGLSFEIFKHVEIVKPVIFTTAYEEYSIQAFKVNSIDYLLKPINFNDLQASLDKYKKIVQSRMPSNRYDYTEIAKVLTMNHKQYKKRFIVKLGSKIQFKETSQIDYIYAEGKIVYIVLKDSNTKYMIDHTLEELEGFLLDPSFFFRINRKFIVKIDAIRELKNHTNNRLKVFLHRDCDMEMIVSREKVSSFKRWLNQ
ncbi:LytTR family DNA-binding domain-containing protein [Fulvivirgaceae bacterium BMA12]|uniref:LytTR family DNA-binding domain-containing protein n=1 Tax=Agaribacillus aureus TaxID=3051825 RepID=A0ABT8L3F1_9BACT|nr:LytTR family DNA-binding domain-containing protein [Fulvivirgaceae bacterium BMA12]